ncbi:MAG: hypothetical protein ACTSWW_03340 [Promethearchaeota archaeon]
MSRIAEKNQSLGSFPTTDDVKRYESISSKQRLQFLRIQGLCAGSQECCEKDVAMWQYLLETDAEAAQLDHYAGYKLATYLTPRKHF